MFKCVVAVIHLCVFLPPPSPPSYLQHSSAGEKIAECIASACLALLCIRALVFVRKKRFICLRFWVGDVGFVLLDKAAVVEFSADVPTHVELFNSLLDIALYGQEICNL